ncbi:hypothetical protein SUGI_0552410 [Cryptomeria japonica]|nr:hypothetical protein SUGI_0552410 [Cryptomeria japonica]
MMHKGKICSNLLISSGDLRLCMDDLWTHLSITCGKVRDLRVCIDDLWTRLSITCEKIRRYHHEERNNVRIT